MKERTGVEKRREIVTTKILWRMRCGVYLEEADMLVKVRRASTLVYYRMLNQWYGNTQDDTMHDNVFWVQHKQRGIINVCKAGRCLKQIVIGGDKDVLERGWLMLTEVPTFVFFAAGCPLRSTFSWSRCGRSGRSETVKWWLTYYCKKHCWLIKRTDKKRYAGQLVKWEMTLNVQWCEIYVPLSLSLSHLLLRHGAWPVTCAHDHVTLPWRHVKCTWYGARPDPKTINAW